eukprot:m.281130 g.281130  ORF g.281130 m.281130 type:complete len:135 (+) comp17739_c0_seq3:1446-1850(+)
MICHAFLLAFFKAPIMPFAYRHGPFDICACDMNVERKVAYEFVKLVTPHLAIDGRLVLTIKMPVRSEYLTPVIREVQDNLRSWGYGNITVTHLFANKKLEFTVIADRLSESSLLQHAPTYPLHDDVKQSADEST